MTPPGARPPPPGPPLVHVIDDDAEVSWAVATLLQAAGMPAHTYASAHEFLAELPSIEWPAGGCVLTDIRMPGKTGLDLLHDLRERGFRHPVVVMTAHGDVATAVRAMKAGASDFVEKPFDDEALLSTLRSAMAGPEQRRAGTAEPPRSFSPRSSRQRADIALATELVATLSAREREVLELAMEGKPSKVIAFELGISPRTVEVYRMKLMARLGVGSFAEAVRLAVLAQYGG
ncbi:DNA-binding response regulator [Pseudoroseomonas rhizosphaerae]|uniref:DNA-binding response regulator n=1 Tax=Teichococcus rhizosphaerae TaxID=1335062 RepID=A0A2C7A820_9PROT|nr:response regulator [Pseudoroseomonas rhizosphaerae]PHK93184.1 DNA-binding response regulator [Pseudoroseomonas rhizosphaerae]